MGKGNMKNFFLFIWETVKIFIIAALIVVPIRYFLFQPFIIFINGTKSPLWEEFALDIISTCFFGSVSIQLLETELGIKKPPP